MAKSKKKPQPTPEERAYECLEKIIAYGYIYHDLKVQERAAIKAGDTATVKRINAIIVDVQVEQRILNEKRLKLLGKYPKKKVAA